MEKKDIQGKYEGFPIQTIHIPEDATIVIKYNPKSLSRVIIDNTLKQIQEAFPKHKITTIPDGVEFSIMSNEKEDAVEK